MKIEKILIPVDLSPACAWAVQYSAQLARRFHAELYVLHVGSTSRKSVEEFVERVAGDRPYEVAIQTGDPGEGIVNFVEKMGPSLVVMPTRSHGKFRRFLLGSVTAKVLHDVDCPVITGVHLETSSAAASADWKQIVCGVDTDASFVPVVRKALEIATPLHASLTLVHAVPAADELSDNPGVIEVRKYLFKEAEEKFAALRHKAGIDAAVSIAGGAVATVVREAALRNGADLVIIGRGHTQRNLGRLRTSAYSIIRTAPCPVLSL